MSERVVNGVTSGKRLTGSDIVNRVQVSAKVLDRQSVDGVGHGDRGGTHLV